MIKKKTCMREFFFFFFIVNRIFHWLRQNLIPQARETFLNYIRLPVTVRWDTEIPDLWMLLNKDLSPIINVATVDSPVSICPLSFIPLNVERWTLKWRHLWVFYHVTSRRWVDLRGRNIRDPLKHLLMFFGRQARWRRPTSQYVGFNEPKRCSIYIRKASVVRWHPRNKE